MRIIFTVLITLLAFSGPALASSAAVAERQSILLRPAQVFDGVEPTPHPGWQVLITGDTITAVGPLLDVPPDTRTIDLPGQTLIPGMIEGHGHLFLHPYDEAKWDDQVLHESLALRTRARS